MGEECEKRAWGRLASAVKWCDAICDDEVNNWSQKGMIGVFCKSEFEIWMVIWFYRSMLMYTILYEENNLDRRYAEALMSVSVRDSHKCVVQLCNDLKDGDEGIPQAWTAPAVFNL